MTRRYILACLFFLVMPLQVNAAEIVAASEIRQMLTGNSILGTWQGAPYRQYFAADGVTIYAPKASRSTRGKWRVSETENTYQSWWERSDWASYRIVREEGKLFWTNMKDEYREPFEVLPGQQLVWE